MDLKNLTAAEKEVLDNAVEVAFDFANDTCTEDLFIVNGDCTHVTLSRDEMKKLRDDVSSKVDRLLAIVSLREKVRAMK